MKRFLSIIAGLALSVSAIAQHENPENEIPSFEVADGYQINLFASERDGVVKPIQLRFDAAGRLWVIGSTVYPQIEPGKAPNDKVVVLEDTDGDGRADKSSVFADGLMIPTGIELGDGGVYIGQTTTLLHLRDSDGDGKADERRVVLRGFGTGDSHQTINSFTWGPAGELMMCQGLHALSRVETPWGIERLHSAGVWRLRPRTLKLDAFLNEEMGPQNPFGIVFDRWGGVILIAGNGQGIYDLTPAMIRAPQRRVLPSLWNTGRKFGGGDFVENSHFPPEAQGELITGNYLNNSVYRFKVTEQGSGYAVTDLPPLITSTNKSFRIVDVRFGPDGALYLCDWWNPVIGHYQASFRHPDRDKTRGRIWRVTAKGRALVSWKKLETASLASALEELKSPERWNRQMAKRVLASRKADDVVPAVRSWAAALETTSGDTELHLFEAAGVLESHGFCDTNILARLVSARNHRARAYAGRILGHLHATLPNAAEILERLVNDPHPRVRLEAIVAASYFSEARVIETVLQAVDHPLDVFLEYSLAQTIHTLKPHWIEPFKRGKLSFKKPRHLEVLVATDASADTLDVVRERFAGNQIEGPLRLSFARIMAEAGTSADAALLLKGAEFGSPSAHAQALNFLRENFAVRQIRPGAEAERRLQELARSESTELRAAALRLWAAYGMPLNSGITEAALDPKAPASVRAAAAEVLGSNKAAEPLARLIESQPPEPALVAAFRSLADVNLSTAAHLAARELSKEGTRSREMLGIFVDKRGGLDALLEAFKRVRPSDSSASALLEVMAGAGKRHDSLADFLRESVKGSSTGLSGLDEGELAGLALEVSANGDPRRGREIYHRAELGCVACHAIGGEGGAVGPDLVSLGTAQDVPFIIGAILKPNKEVKEGFNSVSILTKDDEEFQGYIARETAQEVVLRVPPNNDEIRIARASIKSRQQHGSLMPEGLCDSLSREEFRDLVRFLSELGVQKR